MKKNPSFQEMIRMPVVFEAPGMDAVTVRPDVEYRIADGQPLHMDVYAPAGPPRSRPAVILIHGGPVPMVGAKNMGVFVSYGKLLAASGFVAIAFNHRFLAPNRLPDAAADVAALVAYARENAAHLGIDAGRLALWAFSGGGPLLAAPLRERAAWLRAVVAYYAPLDLQQPAYTDASIDAETRQRFSPLCSLGDDARSAPPILIARAGRDNAWINGCIDRFVQVALERGATLDLMNHPEGRHGFDVIDDQERSKEIIARTLEFVRHRLAARD